MGTTRYVPYDYQRVCDICGVVRNRSKLVEHAGYVFVCPQHKGERTELELSELISQMEPIRMLPAPDPKPYNLDTPNLLRADDAATFNFLYFQATSSAGARYVDVTNGDGAPIASPAFSLQTRGWAARYFYDLIQQGTANPEMLAQAAEALESIANTVMIRQFGALLAPTATRANSALYGGFLQIESPAGWYSEDAAVCGLALLYAYRVLGTPAYLVNAKAAASFLRNCQAIGSDGTNFTSTDAAGTTRLYTGGITRFVANVAGFYSDHWFLPSCLLALEFWKELKATAGDIDVGASAAVAGFDSVPECLLSEAIADLREFAETGAPDVSTGTTINGFSASTPFEVFNAYPQVKPNTSVTGTGRWEYVEGTIGVQVTGLNWAKGLGALYAYEGYSEQVEAIDTYLRGFESNPDFETADDAPPSVVAAASTGEYDATQGIATLLDVVAEENASSLYDWGAFGCMARLYGAQHKPDLIAARANVLGVTQRFDNGIPADGNAFDRIGLRGRSGLSFQTSFTETIASASRRVKDAVAAAQWATAYRV